MPDDMVLDLAAAICERLERNFIVQPTLTLGEAAEAMGVSIETMRKLCLSGKIPHVKLDRLYRIKPKDLNQYIEENYKAVKGRSKA